MNNEEVLSLIKKLGEVENYYLRKHARERMNERNMTTSDIKDILTNPKKVLRSDTENEDGITSYKIEGGVHNHRFAVKFDEEQAIIIITVMNRR
ncbi:DUF4258 domain-containing protein [Paenibacillus lautus]|uniref:DUF4258 domain-containing protein n=1 Tax=Paenibacillus lautus TaxID=1401 RepID=UPI001C7D2FAA|nr:DUF4258 domain-containing protein [Paenibacillus lautus]MBX4152343.1 DUF4258 domain-containing protein [Paenibacillus lautus]